MRLIDPSRRNFDEIYRHFVWHVPHELNIATVICDQHRNNHKTAIFYENETGKKETASFAQLHQWANRFANTLKTKGIGRGDRVAILTAQRIETVISHYAVYKLGAIAVPLSILFGGDAIQFRLQDSGTRMVIHTDLKADLLQSLSGVMERKLELLNCDDEGSTGFWQQLNAGASTFENEITTADDPALLIYTSGTTGPPKGAVIGHRAAVGNLSGFEMSHNFFPAQGDFFWTPADWAWTGGLWDALLPSLYFGIPVLAYEGGKFDPELALRLMQDYQVRNSFIPPTALKMMRQVDDIPGRYKLNMRSIMSAGESVGEELIHWGRTVFGFEINEMWGQTEFNYLVGNCSAILPVKPGSIGKPYPGHRVEPIDENGNVLPNGETGELAADRDDPVRFIEYWNQPEATNNKFIGDWFCTGDVGYRDDEGYLWFVGRKDDVISSSGYRIGPGEIEDVLLRHPAVAQAAVIGVPDELRGQIIKAFLVLSQGYMPSDALKTAIQDIVRKNLAAYEYPRQVEFIETMPMTTTGKVRRTELRQMEAKEC